MFDGMDEPHDIRKMSSRELMTTLLTEIRRVRANKAAKSGMELLSKDEWASALEDFREAQELFEGLGDNVQSSAMLSVQGLCLFALNELDEAAETMKRAIALKDSCQLEGRANDLLGLGEILLKKGDFQGALKSFNDAVKILKDLKLEADVKRAEMAIEKVEMAMEKGR